MTEQEYAQRLADTGKPHDFITVNGKQRLRCLDLTQIPGAHREYFDEQGVWINAKKVEASKTTAVEGDEQTHPVTLKGKLPEDFPGLAALEAAGITTYAQLRKAGDVTEIDGIGPATTAKIHAALAQDTEEDK